MFKIMKGMEMTESHSQKVIRDFRSPEEEEQRLDMMLAYCQETDESLSLLEKQTRGMRPNEVADHLSAKKSDTQQEAESQ